jgi:hypothetical protein
VRFTLYLTARHSYRCVAWQTVIEYTCVWRSATLNCRHTSRNSAYECLVYPTVHTSSPVWVKFDIDSTYRRWAKASFMKIGTLKANFSRQTQWHLHHAFYASLLFQ